MRRRLAAPDLGVVHDVVVDQQVGVEELGRQGERQDLLVRGAAAGAVGVVDERRAQPLAAVGGELADAVDQLQRLGGAGATASARLAVEPVAEGAVEPGRGSRRADG